MENYKCSICSEISESSVTCLDCQKIICKKHFNSDNYCPCCRKFPFKYEENTILRIPILDTNCIYIYAIFVDLKEIKIYFGHIYRKS